MRNAPCFGTTFTRPGHPRRVAGLATRTRRKITRQESFPEVRDCFMIYGGQVANASTRHRKQERREVCSVKVAAPVYLDWSDKPITFDQGTTPTA